MPVQRRKWFVDELGNRDSGLRERLAKGRPTRPIHAHRNSHHRAVELSQDLALTAAFGFGANVSDHIGNNVNRATVDSADTNDLLAEVDLGRAHGVAVHAEANFLKGMSGFASDNDFFAFVPHDGRDADGPLRRRRQSLGRRPRQR